MEWLSSIAKGWLMLDDLRLRFLERASIHICFCFTAMLAVALTIDVYVRGASVSWV